jgi:hypothetical protein
MNTFHEDLEAGLAIEQRVLQILQKQYPCATLINAHKGYDIWIPEIHKSVEVKSDQKSQHTGNFVIEIEMYGKPSGLMSTTADVWVIYDGEIFFKITPRNITKCIFLNRLQYVEFVGNGDTQVKKAFLVPKNILFKYGEPL